MNEAYKVLADLDQQARQRAIRWLTDALTPAAIDVIPAEHMAGTRGVR